MMLTKTETRNVAIFFVAAGLVGGRGNDGFKSPTDGHFFDIRKNRPEEVARVFIEEADVPDLRQRVTSSVLNSDIEFSRYNVHAEAEREATLHAFELAKKYNLIFWISPESEIYADGRLNIYRARQGESEMALDGKHMPLLIGREKSLELGRKLMELGGKTLGPVETVEDLRVQPIGFAVENIGDWINRCREMMPEFDMFWEMFERGDDLKLEKQVLAAVERAQAVAGGDNIRFQREMANMGHLINMMGNHGMGWSEPQVHSFKIEMIGNTFYTEPVYDRQGRLTCPVCGATVSEGERVCGKCGIGLRRMRD